jgi:putative oxidoreductase
MEAVPMTTQTDQGITVEQGGGTRLLVPALAPFYAWAKPLSYPLLRAAFGFTIVTHGLPKLTGSAHGSMADPMAGSANMIENVIGLPFAPQLAMSVALLEAFGGLAVAIGLGTRLFAPMLAVQMLFIAYALGPTYPWIDRGIEYPIILGFMALLISIHGGGPFSADARIGREL